MWFTLSDPLMAETVIDTPCFRRFVGIETMEGRIPDETAILHFRHLLEEHRIAEQMLERMTQVLSNKGVALREGISLDASNRIAPSSTDTHAAGRAWRSHPNNPGKREPEMHSIAKGLRWFFCLYPWR